MEPQEKAQIIKDIKKEITAVFDDNQNYFSSYTGTPMLMPDKAIPKIMKIITRHLK